MSVGDETFYCDLLITKLQNKPPTWSVEKVVDATGKIEKVNLLKSPRQVRGWVLHLGKDSFKRFNTKRAALDFFVRLVSIEAAPIRAKETLPEAEEFVLGLAARCAEYPDGPQPEEAP
jgi:hypothetical protein